VIGGILPGRVAVAEAFEDLPGTVLYPSEEAVIANAVEKRRREFTTARACARRALAALGVPPAPIVPGLRGAPQWPDGIVGSITHCAGYRGCAVARQEDVVTLGLDAEPHERLPSGVLEAISSGEERDRIAALRASAPGVCWDRMLFCVKETVYKSWFPLTRRWLGFEEASVDFDPESRTFTARLLVAGPVVNGAALTLFRGRWLVSNGLIATAIVITRAGADARSAGPAEGTLPAG
jgi:4'-phosphopantetheinyl transferase EntD